MSGLFLRLGGNISRLWGNKGEWTNLLKNPILNFMNILGDYLLFVCVFAKCKKYLEVPDEKNVG